MPLLVVEVASYQLPKLLLEVDEVCALLLFCSSRSCLLLFGFYFVLLLI